MFEPNYRFTVTTKEADTTSMRIGETTGTYGMYPFMTRVSVGDRPITALVATPESRQAGEYDDLRPYNIPTPTYTKSGRGEAESSFPQEEPARRISIVA